MPKQAKPIEFEKLGPNLYRTGSRSTPGDFHNIGVISDGHALCTCYAGNRRGQNGCAHAQALVAAGLAKREPDAEHHATSRPGGRGESNFVVECSCGYVSNIATLDEEYARRAAREHAWAYSDEAIEKRRNALWS